jgi:hypothetical protein
MTVAISQNTIMAGVLLIVIIAGYLILTSAPSKYDDFARCISASGAKMYGAYWCPHCIDQKGMFGNSWHLINYVECSLPDNAGQTQACIDAGVKSYPTWEFGDKTRKTGALTFEELGAKTGCAVPG